MAFQQQRLASFLARFSTNRYSSSLCPQSSISLFPFSNLDVPPPPPVAVDHNEQSEYNNNNNNNDTKSHHFFKVDDECRVLDQLSHLLPIRHTTSIPNNTPTDNSSSSSSIRRTVDGFLSPDEKLRGIFLHKLRGKTAIERALTNAGVELTIDVAAKVVNSGNLGGEAMVMFFNWAVDQPEMAKAKHTDTYHVILKALGRRKFFTYMMGMLRDMSMKGICPNSETIFIVIDSFARARKVSKAIQIFGQLEEFGSKCDTESLNVLLQCLCQRTHVATASSFLNKMKGKISFSRATYNHIICGWSKFGRVTEIERCLKAMIEDGFDPDCLSFSYLIEGLGRAGQVDDAAEIFESLAERGSVPNTGVYNAMISNFISVGDFAGCMKYYDLMLSNKCDPNSETYTRLIGAFLKARKVSDAIELFDEMLKRGIIPSTGTITSFLEPLCTYGPPHAALMIYKKARKVGCNISLNAYKLLLMRLSRFGKCGMLLTLWNDMQESGYSCDIEVYEHVINGLCNIGQLETAVLVMEESLRNGFCPSRLICSKLNNKLLTSNKVEKTYKLFLKIKDARQNENARRYWRAKGWHF